MPVQVLVVDDSAFMRKVISDMLTSHREIEVIATARNGLEALEKIKRYKPQVVTLDVQMPEMDGITTLKQIMLNQPTPVIMFSSLTRQGSQDTLSALSLGAVDFIAKPSGFALPDLSAVKGELIHKVKMAAKARLVSADHMVDREKLSRDISAAAVNPPKISPGKKTPGEAAQKIIAIGSSTGGPKALEQILVRLPGDLPAGVLITQHMPEVFTRYLAERMNRLSPLHIKEAQKGDTVRTGQVLIAPGGYHMKLDKSRKICLSQEPPVQHVRPSVDVMMLSLANCYHGRDILGVILTGMGKDGADGMKAIKIAGGKTVVQDQSTCVIFSMPKAVITGGCADMVLPLSDIARQIIQFC